MGGLRFGFICIFHCYYYHCLRQHAIVCVAWRTAVGWYFIRLPSSFLRFGFQVPLILGSGALAVVLFLLKIGFFFFTGVLVFWFLVLKFYTRYFYFSLVRSSISCFYFGISPLSLLPFYIACMRYSLLCLLPFLFLFLFCLFFVGWDG